MSLHSQSPCLEYRLQRPLFSVFPLQDIDSGKLWTGVSAPAMARTYWRLPDGADMKDLVLAVRADEACHSHVNHTFSQIKPDEPNPFGLGSHEVP